jgi:hypothetical protein
MLDGVDELAVDEPPPVGVPADPSGSDTTPSRVMN